ncbi:MAG: phospholipase A [Pseudomonadota bacterium]|nr:MAG: phospholipase A [Pseudomonadota bacterium]
MLLPTHGHARWLGAAIIACFLGTAALAETSGTPPPAVVGATESTDPSGPQSAIDRRRAEELAAKESRFAITPYKPNYLLPLSYNANPDKSFEDLDRWEIKFQLSLRLEITQNVFGTGGNLHFGYTQQSYWQALNSDISSPFRETNYEPEIMWSYFRPKAEGGLQSRGVILGFSHQSNGRTVPLSRSWNRLYANFIFEYENFYFSLKPWYRIPEDAKSDPLDASGDDNPDILDYMGRGEVLAMWALGDQRVGLLLRNNLKSDNKGATQLDWSFPIGTRMLGYMQYFYGYGESLIDYNHRVNRLSIGIMLNNWL